MRINIKEKKANQWRCKYYYATVETQQYSQRWSGFHNIETKYFICNVKWEEFLPSWVRSSFNAWEAKNLIGGQKYIVAMSILKPVT